MGLPEEHEDVGELFFGKQPRVNLSEIAALLIRIDGDRDPTAGSNLTVEQVMAIATELQRAAALSEDMGGLRTMGQEQEI